MLGTLEAWTSCSVRIVNELRNNLQKHQKHESMEFIQQTHSTFMYAYILVVNVEVSLILLSCLYGYSYVDTLVMQETLYKLLPFLWRMELLNELFLSCS